MLGSRQSYLRQSQSKIGKMCLKEGLCNQNYSYLKVPKFTSQAQPVLKMPDLEYPLPMHSVHLDIHQVHQLDLPFHPTTHPLFLQHLPFL